MKAKETPSTTKPVGGKGDERKESAYPKKAPTREHPHKIGGPGEGYKKVGTPSKQGGDDARKVSPKDKSIRKHPHQGL